MYVDERNQYNVIMTHAEKLNELAGPVYQLEQFKHSYSEIQKNLAELAKPQFGPVMTCNHKSSFNEIAKQVDRIQNLSWPVYECDHSSKFVEIKKSIDTLKTLNYPVMNVDHQNKFNEFSKQVESLKDLAGPVYNTQKSYQHTFTPDSAKVESVKDLNYPLMNIDRDHHYAEIMKAAEKVKEIEK